MISSFPGRVILEKWSEGDRGVNRTLVQWPACRAPNTLLGRGVPPTEMRVNVNRPSLAGLEEVRRYWGLLLTLGIVLLLLGVVAFAYTFAASLISVMVFGWLLVGSGLFQGLLVFQIQSWSGLFLRLLGGILEVIVGMFMVAAPAQAAPRLTLLLVIYLLIGGLFRAG